MTSGFKGDDFVIAKWSRYSVKVICFLYLINRSGYAYPVIIAERSHLFPSRTQQLSSSAPRIPGGSLPGKLGRCRFHRAGWYITNLLDCYYGSMVKRLRHRPFTAVTRVRFSLESPVYRQGAYALPIFIGINAFLFGALPPFLRARQFGTRGWRNWQTRRI